MKSEQKIDTCRLDYSGINLEPELWKTMIRILARSSLLCAVFSVVVFFGSPALIVIFALPCVAMAAIATLILRPIKRFDLFGCIVVFLGILAWLALMFTAIGDDLNRAWCKLLGVPSR